MQLVDYLKKLLLQKYQKKNYLFNMMKNTLKN